MHTQFHAAACVLFLISSKEQGLGAGSASGRIPSEQPSSASEENGNQSQLDVLLEVIRDLQQQRKLWLEEKQKLEAAVEHAKTETSAATQRADRAEERAVDLEKRLEEARQRAEKAEMRLKRDEKHTEDVMAREHESDEFSDGFDQRNDNTEDSQMTNHNMYKQPQRRGRRRWRRQSAR